MITKKAVVEKPWGIVRKGGSLGSSPTGLIKAFDTKKAAQEVAKRWNKRLTPGERKYYKIWYKVIYLA